MVPLTRHLPVPPGLVVERIEFEGDQVGLTTHSRSTGAACPRCPMVSGRVQSRYLRTLADLPWHHLTVTVRVPVRCSVCRRRAAIEVATLKNRRPMDSLGSLPLRCTSCGSGKVERWMPTERQEAEAFLAGELVPER